MSIVAYKKVAFTAAVVAVAAMLTLPAWASPNNSQQSSTLSESESAQLLCENDSCKPHIMMLHRQARWGDLHSLAIVAMLYLTGDGVERDIDRGLEYMKVSAKYGNEIALFALATWYRNGQWVEKNEAQANEYLQRAIAKEYPPAQYQMALQLFARNTAESNQEGSQMLELAARRGSAPAMFLLARLKLAGELVEYDLSGAATLLRRLSINGHNEARALSRQLIAELDRRNQQNTEQADTLAEDKYAKLAEELESSLDIERIQVTGSAWGRSDSALSSIAFQRDRTFNRGSLSRIRTQECNFENNCASVSPSSRHSGIIDMLSDPVQ